MKTVLVVSVLFLTLTLTSTPSHAFWWMGYHKPEFHGKVIDAETKEPIEGAVVVAVYEKKSIGIAESYSVVINVKEVLTDKNGEFHIPSYTTILQPLSWEYDVDFIIFKPGYGSFPDGRIQPPKGMQTHKATPTSFEDFFSSDFGMEKELWWSEPYKIGAEYKKIKVTFGIVELPKLKTWKERSDAEAISPTFYEKEWPLLHEMIKKEDKWLKNNRGWRR